MKLVWLRGRHDEQTRRLSAALAPFGNTVVNNPSMAVHGDRTWLAFRHLGEAGTAPFEATLLEFDSRGEVQRSVALWDWVRRFGVVRLSDPKLVTLFGDLWLTFNTGYDRRRNELYLMRVTPELSPPHNCELSGRQSVEKNWAFFEHGERLRAIYGLDPLRVIESEAPGSAGRPLTFRPVEGEFGGSTMGSLSIGTQMIRTSDDGALLVAHEKRHLAKFRAYVGRLVRIDGLLGVPRATVSPRRLAYSPRSLLGEFPKYNPWLLSCTYFSGLLVDGDVAWLGFGVNDLHAEFAAVKLEDL